MQFDLYFILRTVATACASFICNKIIVTAPRQRVWQVVLAEWGMGQLIDNGPHAWSLQAGGQTGRQAEEQGMHLHG